MSLGDKLCRRLVSIVADRLVAEPEDSLVDVVGEMGGSRNHLHHLAELFLKPLGCGIAQCVSMYPRQLGEAGHMDSQRLGESLRRDVRRPGLLQALNEP